MLILITAVAGCGRPDSTSRNEGQNVDAATEYDGLTAAKVVAKMVDTYRNATSYMDNAEYAEHYSDAKRGVPQQTHPHVTSVLLQRPNRFRITRFVPAVEGPPELATVVCDGKRLLADVSDLGPQVLDIEAPTEMTFESIAPDPLLRSAMFPVPIENLYPQLDLLLAEESTTPWPATVSGRLEMLPPSGLERKGHPAVECFRVRLPAALGAYVYWIDRKSFLLHRLELPSDEVRKLHYADRDLGSYQLVIDFYDVAIDVDVPNSAFAMEVPEGAERVEKLEERVSPRSELVPGPPFEAPGREHIDREGKEEASAQAEKG